MNGVITLSNAELLAELSALNKDVAHYNTEAAEYENLARGKRDEAARLQPRISAIRNEIDRRNRPAPEPRISDHALLRYIERAHGIDLDLLRGRILTPYVIAAITAGAARVTVDGIKFVVKENVIVTALGEEQRTKHRAIKTGRGEESAEAAIQEGIAEYEDEKRFASFQ